MDIMKESALTLSEKIKRGELTIKEVLDAQFAVIKEREERFHCYVTLIEKEAYEQAEVVQKRINRGELRESLLVGVPIAIKDNICTEGVTTTCSSKMLENFVPPYDATVITRLKEAGAIIIGKLNMDEFAMGSTTETSYFGVTKNPWDETRVPGGSSGGAAAAVAAEEAFLTLGSDTGGSIRQPSAFCGVVGIKPTYGTVSRYGLVAYASSLDQIGPMGRNVEDCAAALEVISGHDKNDTTSVQKERYQYREALVDDVKGMRIAIPKSYLTGEVQEEVRQNILQVAETLREKGAIVEQCDLSGVEYAIPAYYVIASAEASSNLSRYDGIKYGYRSEEFEGLQELYKKTRNEGFGLEVKRRMLIGAYVLSSGYYDAYYNKALRVKAFVKKSFDAIFEEFDAILGPTTPTTALKMGQNEDPVKTYLGDIFTVSVNLAGLPAISIPCGVDTEGLPIGAQFIGKPFGEKDILRIAYSYEKTREYFRPTSL